MTKHINRRNNYFEADGRVVTKYINNEKNGVKSSDEFNYLRIGPTDGNFKHDS
jgi:hypothetical protein